MAALFAPVVTAAPSPVSHWRHLILRTQHCFSVLAGSVVFSFCPLNAVFRGSVVGFVVGRLVLAFVF
jgi:hypothetical protein